MSTATITREAYAVSYDRISRVRSNEHTPEITVGNDRQHDDNAAYAANELGGIRERFREEGSASRFRTKDRDRWLAMLDEIRSGRVTHVLVWVLDRVIRDDADRVELINACRNSGAVIVQTGSGTVIDPSDPDSVFLATILGAVAVLEVEKMSKRIRRFKQARRDAGLPHGGKRWFGYLDADELGERKRNMQADPVEAAIFRDLVARFLGGEALFSLAKSLHDKGVPTTAGGVWTGPNLRSILANPRYAALVVHKGEVVGPGVWEALIDEETHARVVRKLAEPSRKTTTGNARVYLLAGLGVCAECGDSLRGRPLHHTTYKGDDYGDRAYACKSGRHVHRSVMQVDRVVEALVIDRLARMNKGGALVEEESEDEAVAMRAALRELDVMLDADDDAVSRGELSQERANKRAAKYEKRRRELVDALGKLDDKAPRALAVLDGFVSEAATLDERRAHARAAWDRAELGRRRELVALLFERVALRGGRGSFDPQQVEVAVRNAL